MKHTTISNLDDLLKAQQRDHDATDPDDAPPPTIDDFRPGDDGDDGDDSCGECPYHAGLHEGFIAAATVLGGFSEDEAEAEYQEYLDATESDDQ